jgi:hypothetical protein
MPSASALHQPKQRIRLLPVLENRAEVFGVIGLRTQVSLHVEAVRGAVPVPLPFVIDSEASCSIISLELAASRRIPVPPPEAETDLYLRTAQGTTSVRVRPGRVRLWWDRSLQGYPFDWPVLFRVRGPVDVPSTLGLGGVVKTCRWTFDGTFSPDTPHGSLMLEDTR